MRNLVKIAVSVAVLLGTANASDLEVKVCMGTANFVELSMKAYQQGVSKSKVKSIVAGEFAGKRHYINELNLLVEAIYQSPKVSGKEKIDAVAQMYSDRAFRKCLEGALK